MKLESSEDQSVIFAMITTSSIGLIISLLVVIVLAINLWLRSHQRRQTWTFATSSPFVNQDEKTPLIHDRGNTVSQRNENEKNGKTAQDEAPKIVPLPDFNWKTTEPLKFRPFKPRYHITMALQNSTPSDLIIIDNNYLSRIRYRQETLSLHADEVMGVLPEGREAVRELYTYLLGEYLPVRYPGMFRVVSGTGEDEGEETGKTFQNLITNASFRLFPPPSDPLDCLRVIAQTVEDDFFLLLPFPCSSPPSVPSASSPASLSSPSCTSPTNPSPNSPSDTTTPNTSTQTQHYCVAFLNIHPSGFTPLSKLGLPLSQIHSPVPSYSKIGPSMERFFSRLPTQKLVKRVNWGIQLHSELYSPSGNHVHQEDLDSGRVAMEEVKPEDFGDTEAEEARLRVELQGCWRLRETKAVVFGFKTYLYGLKEVKGEVVDVEMEGDGKGNGGKGNTEKMKMGEALAQAIEGLGEGNAPGMWRYKGAVRWGGAVVRWLRS
ncbi:hypothetical protein SMACR_12077 [Sordaria macrospora]|uniref:Uncharacterized protein n=1 Tax=Sordaria macrospora TaxID=5147 RepID=A0A8S8ZMV8_SORMA|nr:hypothetical protein SMACR_12077 [Sordaria macrospora]WPJ65227.1 hypothetical protein SMAC4_12077 [Sordaria macrospora]